MKASLRVASLPLVLSLGLLLTPHASLAASANCPVEPKTGVPIASGDVYAGTNCTINTPADVDSFVFNANSGDEWQIVVGFSSGTQNVCLSLYNPSAVEVFSGCSGIGEGGNPSVVADETLAVTGTYTMVITEPADGTVNYGASLERIYPTPPDAQAVTLGEAITGNIAPVADTPAFTFAGVTTGTFQVAASLPSNAAENLCVTVFSPVGASIANACTGIGQGGNDFVQIPLTPTKAGTYLVLLSEEGDSGTVGYTLEVSCLTGNCGKTQPLPCTLKDAVSYNATSKVLTMNFTVGNTSATTWNAWLTDLNSITNLFSVAQPITNPPVTVTKNTSLSPEGTVGVLSTLTTSIKGIICSSYVQVNTGTP
jgi:hypothetical protein